MLKQALPRQSGTPSGQPTPGPQRLAPQPHSARRHGLRLSLAGQYLALQLLIVVAVLIGVVAISLAQSTQAFERVEGRRALSAAESVAAMPVVRALIPGAEPRQGAALLAVAESARTVSGSSFVILAKPDLTILTSPDHSQIGSRLALGESDVRSGRAWTGAVGMDGGTALAAHVPVLNDAGQMVGIVAVGREYPSLWERLGDAVPDLLTYLGISLALGTVGSLLLSRRVKRQTLGMEPAEIAGLVEHREALLHGVKEGVVAVDPHHRVTLANKSAREFLGFPEDCVGRSLVELGVEEQLREALISEQPDPDRLLLVGEKLLVINRMPVVSHGRVIGSVTTLRDQTELSSLEKELGATRTSTDTLRAQAHEFANQLHTISGLIQLGEYDEVVSFVNGVSLSRTRLHDDVTTRIQDPALAALLIAKASLAAERVVTLQLEEDAALGKVDERLSRDLTTVVGNLVDNALDAVTGTPDAVVRVGLSEDEHAVQVTVRDSGPGIDEANAAEIFRQGFTTKATQNGGRGFGLAITRVVCQRSGGSVEVRNEGGAVFTARLGKARGRR